MDKAIDNSNNSNNNTRNIVLAGAGAFLASAAIALIVTTRKRAKPLDVVSFVDLEKYAGEWFEIAKFPLSAEDNCTKSKAQYVINKEGRLEVINSCHENGPHGKLRTSHATGIPTDASNARLKLKFNWPFITGDYQILELGSDYEYAMVGTSNRKHLWILSRSPELSLDIVKSLLNKALAQGFDTTKLIFTKQGKA